MEAASARAMVVDPFGLDSEYFDDNDRVDYLLSLPPGERSTAAACWSDTSAYNMLAHCRRLGLRVPDDLAIVSFDGCPTPFDDVWSLTTIRAPWAEVARNAVHDLDTVLKGGAVPDETVLPVEFVQGSTS
jgi:LacI family transcriptional regulator